MTEDTPSGPKRIGKFEVLRHLAQGGMGQVWLARNPDTQQLVAIKETLVADPAMEKRLDREAQILAQLEHPYILPIYDKIREGDKVYVVTRYVSGGTLDDRVADGGTSPTVEELLRWTDQILDALEAAHEKGILHRDIKPSNIFLSDKGDVLVGDFGLARDLDATMSLGVAGTVPFMSPEQLKGEALDGRADLFALGVSLYLIATGELPYSGASRETPPRSLHELRPDLPEVFTALVDSMLQAKAALRTDSATAVREILTGARPAPTHLQRKKPPLARMAVVVLLILAGAVLGPRIWNWVQPSTDCVSLSIGDGSIRRLAILPFAHVGGDVAQQQAEELRRQLMQRFEGAGDLTVVPEESLACFLDAWISGQANGERLETIRAEMGAELALTATVSLSGGKIQARLLISDDSQGEIGLVEGRIVDQGHALEYADQLALLSIPQLFGGPPHEFIRAMSRDTENWIALRHFLNGDLARRYEQDFDIWFESMESCIEQDSTLALAHHVLAEWYTWMDNDAAARSNSNSAVHHMASLPRKIQFLIEARNHSLHQRTDEADRLYATILSEDRELMEAWYQLASFRWGNSQYRGRSMMDARDAFERADELDPRNILPDVLMKFVYAGDGDYEAIADLFDKWSDGNPNSAMRAILAYLRDDPEQQAVYADSLPLGSMNVAQAMILFYPDNHANIEQLMEAALARVEPEIQRGWLRETLAHDLIAMGRWDEARQQFALMPDRLRPWRLIYESIAMAMPFNQATEAELNSQIGRVQAWRAEDEPYLIDPDTKGLIESRYSPDADLHPQMRAYVLGLLHVRVGNLEAARTELQALESLPAPENREEICREYVLTVRAWIRYFGDGAESALETLDTAAQAFLPGQGYSGVQERGPQRWLRARCLEELGRGEEALGWYASLREKTERQYIYVANAHFRRAVLLEGLDRGEEAREQYEIFLRLFERSDPRYAAIVGEARAGLARVARRS